MIMIEQVRDEFLWSQKYRPQTIEDCVLPDSIKNTLKEVLTQGRIPNYIFSGSAGVGKTTAAKALCNEIGADFIVINGSLENGIDVLRTTITQFATTVSLTGAKKVVIIDEADFLNANSVQPALRGFIEEFSKNCSFVFTCNYKNRLIEPLHSRCSHIEFKIENSEKPIVAKRFFKRVCQILEQENIEYDKNVVIQLVMKFFPDNRKIINELQRYSVSGKIDSGILTNLSDENIKALIKFVSDKNFTDTRKWLANNSDSSSTIFRAFYDMSYDILEKQSIPELILLISKYQYQSSFCADQEINTCAFLVECMATLKFKQS